MTRAYGGVVEQAFHWVSNWTHVGRLREKPNLSSVMRMREIRGHIVTVTFCKKPQTSGKNQDCNYYWDYFIHVSLYIKTPLYTNFEKTKLTPNTKNDRHKRLFQESH